MGVRVRTPLFIVLLTIGLAILVPEQSWAQCAMCRSVLASPDGQKLASALRSGILFLLAAPFVTFTTVAMLAVRRRRRRTSMSR
jgi:hypothetical protein